MSESTGADENTVDTASEVPVAIVGAGPAGLMLAHRLHRAGIETVAIDIRTASRSRRRTARGSSSPTRRET